MRSILLGLFLLFGGVTWAHDVIQMPSANVIDVYDGDTFKVQLPGMLDVFGQNLSIRIKGIDAPEIRSSCSTTILRTIEKQKAILARQYLLNKIEVAKWVELRDLERDKYFRLLATVYIDGVLFSEEAISAGHAVAYDGGSRSSWCEG